MGASVPECRDGVEGCRGRTVVFSGASVAETFAEGQHVCTVQRAGDFEGRTFSVLEAWDRRSASGGGRYGGGRAVVEGYVGYEVMEGSLSCKLSPNWGITACSASFKPEDGTSPGRCALQVFGGKCR